MTWTVLFSLLSGRVMAATNGGRPYLRSVSGHRAYRPADGRHHRAHGSALN
ncbi:MAG: hypothetical protein ACE5OQ_10700 [Woeseia sp.]